jgi:hypothetical protein
MAQAATFDTVQIAKGLSWAKSMGMNTMWFFLHNLLYQQDPVGFLNRNDGFLAIATRYNISTQVLLFDSVWHPLPVLTSKENLSHMHITQARYQAREGWH